jgi:hypothetical protein
LFVTSNLLISAPSPSRFEVLNKERMCHGNIAICWRSDFSHSPGETGYITLNRLLDIANKYNLE